MRIPRLALLLGAAAAVLLALYARDFAAVSQREIGRSDFTSSYVGATLIREGQGHRLYDETLQAPLHAKLIAPDVEGNLPFVSPSTQAVLTLPLTAFDLATAYRGMALAQLLLLAAAVVIAVRAAPWPRQTPTEVRVVTGLAALAGTGTLSLLLLGQWDALPALGLAAGYALWRRGHQTAAGFALLLGFCLVKPHLALGVAAFLLARRNRPLLTGAAIALATIVAASLLVAGLQGSADFVHASIDSTHRWNLASFIGFTGLTGSWLGTGPANAAAAAGSIAAVAGCAVLGSAWRRDDWLLEPTLAGATVLSLLASPHLLGHDLAILAPLLVMVTAWATARDAGAIWPAKTAQRVLGLWLLIIVLARLDLGNESMAPPGRLVPWVLIITALSAVAVCRRVEGTRTAPAVRAQAPRAALP
jgi:glycosyl transferase family 87